MAERDQDWLLWQLADSAFPAGGFAHSGGLESALQQGELRDSADLGPFVEASLSQAGHHALPFVTAMHDAPTTFLELDRRCDCFLSNHVANRASRLQGQALLASTKSIFASPGLSRLAKADPGRATPGHLAPVFGLVLRELGMARSDAARLFMFFHLRGLVSAAVRLGIVGPLEAQAVQRRLAPVAEKVSLHCQTLSLHDIAQTAPLLDLWQANHDHLYSRLFQS
jgi:urease accessory protein